MHPCYYGCPKKYLAMAPTVACQEWRDGVMAYWEAKAARRQARKAALSAG